MPRKLPTFSLYSKLKLAGQAAFLSPSLTVADLMRRVLTPCDFAAWIDRQFPAPQTWEPVGNGDPADRSLTHLVGLNFSRSWCLSGLASVLGPLEVGGCGAAAKIGPAEALRGMAAAHLDSALPLAASGAWMGDHWLHTFAARALFAGHRETGNVAAGGGGEGGEDDVCKMVAAADAVVTETEEKEDYGGDLPRRPLVVWCHGGGWVNGGGSIGIGGNDTSLNVLCSKLVASGWMVASVSFRACPEVTFMEQSDDVVAAVRWIHEHAMDVLGIDPTVVVLMGHSTGAHLASFTALRFSGGLAGDATAGAGETDDTAVTYAAGSLPIRVRVRAVDLLAGVYDTEGMRCRADGAGHDNVNDEDAGEGIGDSGGDGDDGGDIPCNSSSWPTQYVPQLMAQRALGLPSRPLTPVRREGGVDAHAQASPLRLLRHQLDRLSRIGEGDGDGDGGSGRVESATALASLPAWLVMHGTSDVIVPIRESRVLVKELRRFARPGGAGGEGGAGGAGGAGKDATGEGKMTGTTTEVPVSFIEVEGGHHGMEIAHSARSHAIAGGVVHWLETVRQC